MVHELVRVDALFGTADLAAENVGELTIWDEEREQQAVLLDKNDRDPGEGVGDSGGGGAGHVANVNVTSSDVSQLKRRRTLHARWCSKRQHV